VLPATLADRLGIAQAADELVCLVGTGAAHPDAKILTVVHGILAGGDCIDDLDVLRCGATSAVLGHQVLAPSTVGTFLRAFTFGHTRQLGYPDTGVAQVAETRLGGDRLIVRRVHHLTAQGELFPTWEHTRSSPTGSAPPSGSTPSTGATPRSSPPSAS